MTSSENSIVSEFYNDKTIFITGASGFMGKVLVEKLLRSCSGVKAIYVLLRSKKEMNARQRLDQMLNARIFEKIKEENPNILRKLTPIQGDISMPGLGLSQADTNLLISSVNIVFHSAATVKFDEPLKQSVEMNVTGTKRLIELCQKMQKLLCVLHVSTAYANCNREEIEEKIYNPPVPPDKMAELAEWMNEDLLNAMTSRLIGDRPNTYTFTKALAESLLENCGSLPVAIVRPSIVSSSWKEPMPGWVDNLNGPTGLIAASSKGLMRTMVCHRVVADLIPVDVVINLMITVAWYTATKRPQHLMVYNCCSGAVNKITWKDIEAIAYPLVAKYPSIEVFRCPGGSFKKSFLWNNICVFFQHVLPAAFVDALSVATGRKPRMLSIYKRLHRAIACLEYFTTRQWTFRNDNVRMLLKQLTSTDKELFNFDISSLDWPTYWKDYVLGTRCFMLKEDHSTIPLAQKQVTRMHYVNRLANLVIWFGLFRLLLSQSATFRRLWWFLLSAVFQVLRTFPQMLYL